MDDDVTKEQIDVWLGEAAEPPSLDGLNTAIARLLREGRTEMRVSYDHAGRIVEASLVPARREGRAHG